MSLQPKQNLRPLASTARRPPSIVDSPHPSQLPSPANLPLEAPEVPTGAYSAANSVTPFWQYAALASVPKRLGEGIPFAFMNCGYGPRCVAKSLKAVIAPSFPPSPTDPSKSFIVPQHTILWLDPEDSPYYRSRGLLLQPPIAADADWDKVSLNGGQWKDGHQKHLLELYKHKSYDGTTWYGMYKRLPLPPSLQYLQFEVLEVIPDQIRVAFFRSLPKATRQDLEKRVDHERSMHRERQGLPKDPRQPNEAEQEDLDAAISFNELAWDLIQGGAIKIPVALVTFEDMDYQALHKARLFRQGPSYQRTLFVLSPGGAPFLPQYQHLKLLERYSYADDLVDVETTKLAEMEQSVARLSLVRDNAQAKIFDRPFRSPKKLRWDTGETQDQ